MILLNLRPYNVHLGEERLFRNRSAGLRVTVRIALEVWALMLTAVCPFLLYFIYIFSHAYAYRTDALSAVMQRKPSFSGQFALIWLVSMLSWCFVKLIPYGAGWVKSSRMLARRLTTVDAASALIHDARPPIMYLRSFLDRCAGTDILAQTESDENLMFPVLKEVGPVIAIGQPGEALPPLGATRLYLDDTCDWQTTVTDYFSRSKLVVISPGYSDGVIWETSKAFQMCPPEKVIISLISFKQGFDYSKNLNDYERFRDAIKLNTNLELPENIGDSLFIYFDSGWKPRKAWADTGGLNYRFAEVAVRDALRQILRTKDIGVSSRMPLGWYVSNVYKLILVSVAILIPIMTVIRVLIEQLS